MMIRGAALVVLAMLLGCGPSKAMPLVAGADALFLTVDDSHLYWGRPWGPGRGQISRVSKRDGFTVEILGRGYQPVALGGAAFASSDDGSDATFNRYHAGQVQKLGTFDGIARYAAGEGSTAYFATATNGQPGSTEVDWRSKLWAQPIDGGPALMLAEDRGDALGIAVSAGEVFWVSYLARTKTQGNQYGKGYAVMKVGTAGGVPASIATFPAADLVGAIAASASAVYWSVGADDAPGDCRGDELVRFDRATSTTTTLRAAGHVRSLALDRSDVYWTARCNGQDRTSGGVYRMPLDGGPVMTVARVDSINGLAVDDDYVYWAESYSEPPMGEGSVMRISKPPH